MSVVEIADGPGTPVSTFMTDAELAQLAVDTRRKRDRAELFSLFGLMPLQAVAGTVGVGVSNASFPCCVIVLATTVLITSVHIFVRKCNTTIKDCSRAISNRRAPNGA